MKREDFTDLYDFITHCEDLIEMETDTEDNDEWLIFALAAQLTEDELLDDMDATFDIYYEYLKEAQDAELFLICVIISKTIVIEQNHYATLTKQVLGKSLKTKIRLINEVKKIKYLS